MYVKGIIIPDPADCLSAFQRHKENLSWEVGCAVKAVQPPGQSQSRTGLRLSASSSDHKCISSF